MMQVRLNTAAMAPPSFFNTPSLVQASCSKIKNPYKDMLSSGKDTPFEIFSERAPLRRVSAGSVLLVDQFRRGTE